MLSKCANPSCSAQFKYLRDGKLFHVELAPGDTTADSSVDPLVNKRVVHFWLCGRCAEKMTITYSRERGVSTIPLRPAA